MFKNKFIIALFTISCFADNTEAQNISAGYYHSTVICSDYSVWSTGSNSYAQKGNTASESTLEFIQSSKKGINTSSGGNNVILLEENNSVSTWGYNKFGQSGSGLSISVTESTAIQELANIMQLESSENSSFAVKNDGSLWSWGYNYSGQLGLGTNAHVETPTKVNIEGVAQISASQTHSLALLKNGKVMSWGNNLYGELGINFDVKKELIPVETSGLSEVIKVVAGTHFSLALKSDGSVWGWGANEHGMLGQGHNNAIKIASPIGGLNNIKDIVAGQYHVLALSEEGEVYSWGLNIYAQLGNGTYNNSNTPVLLSLDSVSMIAAGEYHSIVAKENGEVYTWGFNNSGQLGVGTINNKSTPTKIDIPCLVEKMEPICPTEAIAAASKYSICEGESIDFSNSSQNTTNHKWVVQNQEYEQEGITEMFNEAGEYEVQLIANPDGCSDISVLNITVHEVPNASFYISDQVCFSGDSLELIANGTNGVWSGEGVMSNYFNPGKVTEGSHKIYHSVDNGFCQAIDSNVIDVLPDPIAEFTLYQLNDSTIGLFNSASNYNSIEWLFGDGTSSQEFNPTHEYDTFGVFYITQIVEGYCGTDVIQKQVIINTGTTGIKTKKTNSEIVVYPNPAADIVNIVGIIGDEKGSQITIANPLGQQVFSKKLLYRGGFVEKLDVSEFDSGIYTVSIQKGEIQTVSKLIVTK